MKVKLGIVGPSGSGKTLICNILANEMNMDSSIGRPPYRPTNSVRIVEFSVPNVDLRKYSSEVDVALWEIGGSPRLKSIWPGVQSNLDGIILVYDASNELHVRDMSALHMHFVTHSSLNPMQCLIIGNQFRGNRESGPAKIVGVGPRVRSFVCNIDEDPNYLRDEFRHYLTGVAQMVLDQEKNPPAGYIAPQEGEGDAPAPSRRAPFFDCQSQNLNTIQSEMCGSSNADYLHHSNHQHTSKSNKTSRARNRREGLLTNASGSVNESMRGLGVRDIPLDSFSIHKRSTNNT